MKTIYFLLISLLMANFAMAASAQFCDGKYLESLPIQQGGRVKPLIVHADETIKYMTGKSKVGDMSAISAYCRLSFSFLGIAKDINLKAPIEHVGLKKFLNLEDGQKFISFEKARLVAEDVRLEIRKQKQDSSYKKSLNKFYDRIWTYNEIINGSNWMIPIVTGKQVDWQGVSTGLSMEQVRDSGFNMEKIFKEIHEKYDANISDKHHTEVTFHKSKIFHWSMFITLIALAALVLAKNQLWGLGLTGFVVLFELAGMVLRVMISGRAPITNMYETVMFSGWGGLVMAMAIGHIKKEKIFVIVGLCYNLMCLFMLNFAHGMLSSSISPLVPVLRDNFWLSTHVTTIILSYGALALSWVLANIVLIKKATKGMAKDELKYKTELVYTCLKWGTTLLAAGIILGGVWADYSWGRFWGWDPKETWSLIALCFYMAILHGKYTSWIPEGRFILFTALAFMSVMFAWFGVNYILASGLHSYGFSEGGAIFLGSFFIAQMIIVAFYYLRRKPLLES